MQTKQYPKNSIPLSFLGAAYMTLRRLFAPSEFTPVPSHDSMFVYMIPPQNVMPIRVTQA